MMKNNKGFTLIEILIVIAIMGVLLGSASLYMGNRSKRARLRADASSLADYMTIARVRAVRDAHSWAIQFDPAHNNYKIYSSSGETPPAADDWANGNETIFRTLSLKKGVGFGSGHGLRPGASVDPPDGISFTANRVVFNPNGTSESGTVYLKNVDDDTFAISSLSTTGRIKVWKNFGGGWSN